MTDIAPAPAKKKRSRTRRWAKVAGLIILALILIGFLAHSLLLFTSSRRIRREIAAIKALNEPTNWDELMRSDRDGHVPPEGATEANKELSTLYDRALTASKGWNDALPQSLQSRLVRQPLSPDEVKQLGEALAPYRDAIDLFRQAAQYEGIVILPEATVDFSQDAFDSFTRMREGTRLLTAHARYAAAQGQADEAADDCIVMLQYARAFPGYNLISGLMDIAISESACRLIAYTVVTAQVSPGRLGALQEHLEREVSDSAMIRLICGERVCGSYILQSGKLPMPRIMRWPNHAAYLEVMREFAAISRAPFPDSLDQAKMVVFKYATPKSGYSWLGRSIVPILSSTLDKCARDQALIRATLCSLAVRRSMLDANPMPASLQELVPKYLESVPADPFTGGPLLYRVDDAGCVIYSVGVNGVDDGGSIEPTPRAREEDIGVRVSR